MGNARRAPMTRSCKACGALIAGELDFAWWMAQAVSAQRVSQRLHTVSGVAGSGGGFCGTGTLACAGCMSL